MFYFISHLKIVVRNNKFLIKKTKQIQNDNKSDK